MTLCCKVDTFFALGVNVVDGGIQALTARPVFCCLLHDRLENHLLFIGDPWTLLAVVRFVLLPCFRPVTDGVDGIDTHRVSEVITIVSFYRYIRAYNVPALLFSIEVVVDVDRRLIEPLAAELIVSANNCRLAPLNGARLLCNMHQAHVTNVEANCPFTRNQVSQLLSWV
ncbi:hypothetical protein SDC9_182912 [bioreactor metagenome]|uniref:Uncharacterized protein n=1 Tax=bioreactor metagenome TaxID=1076179 RepID=A0A645HH18_9ZZZZ